MRRGQTIRTFLLSQYFADGLRITSGAIVPALIFSFFGNLQVGITIAMGALVVGLSDTYGPASHRRNGMLICSATVLITAFITSLASHYPILLGLVILVFSFVFAMLAVFGARAATIGSMGILIMVLNMDSTTSGTLTTFEYIGYTMAGCAWYMLLSLSITQARPYRLAQQELGESVRNVAQYIRIKAAFYDTKVDVEKNFLALIDQQITVHEHQDMVRDILFRSKRNIRDTTKIGRMLLLIFSDIVDLFEKGMATHYDYATIQEKYGNSGILPDFNLTIKRIASELDHLGYHIYANTKPKPLHLFQDDLDKLMENIEKAEKDPGLNTLPLKKIWINIRNITQRIDSIYSYFDLATHDGPNSENTDLSKFISKQDIDLKSFRGNLTLDSNTFRHALRMAVVMLLGYIIALQINVGHHSYWILLTIMVILKPGYGVTKQRNYQRLAGTIIGGISGILIVMLIRDETALLLILMLFMVATYSFIRINYIVSVIFMTPFILIMFSLMEMNTFAIAQERIIDTLIGSALAFCSNYVILPSWESSKVQGNMKKLLIANYEYLAQALIIIAGEPLNTMNYKLARKKVYVATANMGSSFQRMITEPKSKQKNAKHVNKFVVFNHIFSSYSVPLLHVFTQADHSAITREHIKILRKTLFLLAQCIKLFSQEKDAQFQEGEITIPPTHYMHSGDSEDSKLITEQLNFLNRIASDIYKVCERLSGQPQENLTPSDS